MNQIGEHPSGSQNGAAPIENAMEWEQSAEVEKSLLQLVLDNDQGHEDLAREWLEQYAKNQTAALVDILQFVVEASGSEYQIPKTTPRPFVYRDIIEASTEEFRRVSKYYPMIAKNSASAFERSVGNFVQCLLKCADGTPIISDQVFLFEVTGFVMACSESHARPIRHTSTMIGLKMLTGLGELPPAEGDGPLRRLWLRMFECLFVDRHQDVVTGIRLLCITELDRWMRKYPEGSLQPNSIRYFYKGLQDGSPDVRKCCLESITELAAVQEELRPVCLELAREFRDLMLLICVDRESELGEDALRLLTGFYRSSPTILSDVDCRVLEQLMFAANRGLSHAAAEFFKLRWMDPQRGSSDSQVIRRLLQFFIGYGQHEHAAYLVDSLIDSCDLILNWQTMVRMLMEDQSPQLTPNETSALIEILSRGVKQAITGEIPPGRYTKDLARKPKPRAQLQATQILAPVMSQLLLKHRSSSCDLENLVELPQHLQMNYYQQWENEDQLDELLNQMKVIMLSHSDNSVLRMGALTLEYLNDIPASKPLIQELLDSAVVKYRQALRTWQQMYGTPRSPASSSSRASTPGRADRPRVRSRSLLHTLRLICALYRHFDLSSYHLTESVLSSLKRVLRYQHHRPSRDDLPVEATGQYLEVAYYSLNWDLRSVLNVDFNRSDLEMEETCAALKKHLEDFLVVTLHLIANGDVALGFDSFGTVCDLFVLFGDPLLLNSSSYIRAMRHEPSINDFDLLENFVLTHIFDGCPRELLKENRFDELQRRRHILSGYCKLLAFNVIPSMRACKILQYYEKHHAAFGDIMRASMDRALDINPINFGMTLLHTCLLPFKRIMTDVNHDGVRAISTLEFPQLTNLARRLGETYNSDLLKNRDSVTALHRAGILYVMESMADVPIAAPRNITFFHVLKEFVPQVLHQDRVTLVRFLQRIEQPALPSGNREEWQPLEEYRSALVNKR